MSTAASKIVSVFRDSWRDALGLSRSSNECTDDTSAKSPRNLAGRSQKICDCSHAELRDAARLRVSPVAIGRGPRRCRGRSAASSIGQCRRKYRSLTSSALADRCAASESRASSRASSRSGGGPRRVLDSSSRPGCIAAVLAVASAGRFRPESAASPRRRRQRNAPGRPSVGRDCPSAGDRLRGLGRWLQRVSVLLAGHLGSGQPTQLFVNQRKQRRGRGVLIALVIAAISRVASDMGSIVARARSVLPAFQAIGKSRALRQFRHEARLSVGLPTRS